MSCMPKVQFLHHSGFLLEFNGVSLLVDPFVNFPQELREQPLTKFPLKKTSIKADIVLVTHEHADHCDIKLLQQLASNGTTIIAHDHILSKLNISRSKKCSIDAHKKLNFRGISIEAFQVHHPTAFYPLGFKISSNDASVIHMGDTYLMSTFSKLRADLLLVPIGGFTTMDTIDAVKLVKSTQPKIAIPMHYNTFPRIKASAEEFVFKIEKSSVKTKAIALRPAEKLEF